MLTTRSKAPDPARWLALDEQRRIQLAEKHHRAARTRLPNLKAHAIFHAIVENQIAEDLDPVVRAVSRLTGEGLTRHEAIHAIASVLAAHLRDLSNATTDESDSAATYTDAIEKLICRELARKLNRMALSLRSPAAIPRTGGAHRRSRTRLPWIP